ncbi:histidine kinase [Malaciobacter halophilus]|uniref:histidine kinase n=1 Tax=Malaciobacter halophilus TaxID=197482 RepID=A0A2N1J3M1_9BACT|nr:sensor histidine kinase [Malaciobacter halophilus]AXH09041.1 7TMR-DISM-7TM/7TMR-DISMED2 domain-containing two-component system sensor histidine kinase [Malaciobacter halophilus]PKI81161.1 histidine kinase [Malaciobacter halophilus]
MRILLLILFYISYSFSSTIFVKIDTKNIDTKSYQKIYFDNTSRLTIGDIVKIDNFKKIEGTNFKAHKNRTIWAKFAIKNIDVIQKKLFFENIKPGIDKIDVYIFKNKKPLRKIELGDLRDINNRALQVRKSTFSLKLEPKALYEIYTKYDSTSSINTSWNILDIKSFVKSQTLESIAWGIFIGIVVTLVLYNLIVFFTMKEISFLIYSFMSCFFAIYQLLVNGFFYHLNLGIDLNILTNSSWTFGYLAQAFIVLFPLAFFKPKKNSFIFWYLVTLFFINIACVGLYSLGYENPDYRYYTKYTDLVTFMTIPTLVIVSIWAVKNKLAGSSFYLLGQVSYLTLVFFGLFVTIGYIEPIKNSWAIIPLGIILDIIFLSLALYMKIKKVEQERLQNEQLLISQSRFSSIGQNIADLTHQWKTPIAQLGSQIALLKATYHLDRQNLEKSVIETLPKMDEGVKFLNETMNDIYNYYSSPLQKDNFNIADEIEVVIRLLKDKITQNHIEIVKEFEDIPYYGHKNCFANSIMSILENSIYQLANYKEKNRKIFLTIKNIDKQILVVIEDNAGGIKTNDFDKLFNIDFSSKKNKGSGIGLALTKRLVQTKLKGTINASNGKQGAIFKILFPK